ncbi:unnamed protein product [Adineta steineri]|uniref:Peptidase metallopeptidase domain-containing protein n=1 Tax=Adineta steineri TaxID=433720 RepID=A0A819X9I2_9BILA|nr:unnamed protein product [Adineta steineri]CAF4137613.1 unnamed protein product [Adineta steineri]
MKQIISIVLLILIEVVSSANNQVKSQDDALTFFNKYGYNPCFNSTVPCSVSFSSMVKDYQTKFHLKPTGSLDEATKKQMSRSRCGNHDKGKADSTDMAPLTNKWSRSSLTYSIASYPTQISESSTNDIIRDAFKAWTDHIPLKIEPACSSCTADFVIEFARGGHGDNYPFDGPGDKLAHAFPPQNGGIHFDADEEWTESFDGTNTNLYVVAVHHIGQALGLDHKYDEQSIMYPSYQLMQKSSILPQVDRTDIQKLYGKKGSTITSRTPRSTSTRKSLTTTRYSVPDSSGKSHPRCRRFLDAAFKHPDGTLHAFDAGVLWRYLTDEKRWNDQPKTYTEIYPNLPNKLAAGVFNTGAKQIVFFTDKNTLIYEIGSGDRVEYKTKADLPRSLHNSIVGAIYYKNEIYVITPHTIRSFYTGKRGRVSKEQDISAKFPGLTDSVKTAFSSGDSHYFFSDTHLVYIWSEQINDWETFGKPMETSWFACSGTETYDTGRTQERQPVRKHKHRRPNHSDHHDRHHHHHYDHHDHHRDIHY